MRIFLWAVVGLTFALLLLFVAARSCIFSTGIHTDVDRAMTQMAAFGHAIRSYVSVHGGLPATLTDQNFELRCRGRDGLAGTEDDVVWPPDEW